MNILKPTKPWIFAFSLLSFNALNIVKADTENQYSVTSNKKHDVTILNNGLAALEIRLEMIERAKKTIDVEYFIYHTDVSSKLITQALVKKAREGVRVRMLLDNFLVVGDFNPFYTHELEKAGIEIKYFNKAGPLNIRYGNYRNHRKLLSVDGVEAITGGRNIGDEYFDLSNEYNFLDRDMYLKGEVVKSIENTFDKFFAADISTRHDRAERPNRLSYYDLPAAGNGTMAANPTYLYKIDLKKWEAKVKLAEDFISIPVQDGVLIRENGKKHLDLEKGGQCKKVSFFSEYPIIGQGNRLHNRVLKHELLKRITTAQKSILLESPYFIVNKELGDALNVALTKENKEDVRLLTNSLNSTDASYVYAIFDSTIQEWIDKGLEPFIFKAERPESYSIIKSKSGEARFGVHAKTFVFDDKNIVIGTYNLDPRSADFNSEMVVACDGNQDLAKIVSDNIEERIQDSFHLNSAEDVKTLEFYQTNFKKRIFYYLEKFPANSFSYLF